MRVLQSCLAIGLVALGSVPAVADGTQPVVVELFTSQGCSSCPPADALLADLATRDDVLPLALHVDYWDYIGWPDEYADPRFTHRQKAYARIAGERMIYTPQIIVGGVVHLIGSRTPAVTEAIEAQRAAASTVDIEVARDGEMVRIEAVLTSGAAPGPMLIQIVPFAHHERVAIRGGENAGAVIDYANIVRDWQMIDQWDGAEPWSGEVHLEGSAAVIVQAEGPGRILGAERVD